MCVLCADFVSLDNQGDENTGILILWRKRLNTTRFSVLCNYIFACKESRLYVCLCIMHVLVRNKK